MKNEKIKNTEETQTGTPLEDKLVRNIVQESARATPDLRPDIFARIEQNLPDEEKAPAQKTGQNRQTLSNLLIHLKNFLFRPQVGWGLAAVQAVVLCFFLAFPGENHQYQTLSRPSTTKNVQNQAASIDLYVMFHDQATVEQIEELLNNLQGRIKDGPTKNGIYMVAFADHTVNQPEGLLKKLHTSKIVTFAEQVY